MRVLISTSRVPELLTGTNARHLVHWLEGFDHVDKSWIDAVSKLTVKFDKPLYRLVTLPKSKRIKVGTLLPVLAKSKLVSASDRVENAVYAGCQWLSDSDVDLSSKKLAVLQLLEPNVCVTFAQLLEAIRSKSFIENARAGHVEIRTRKEREYIVRATGLVGRVLNYSNDAEYVINDDHRLLLPKL